MDKAFTLRYLPLFEEDLLAVRDYIAFNLHNPSAALRLVEDTEKAILKRLGNPLGFQPYPSTRDRRHPYYHIQIRNYMGLYVVIGDIMEVRRFVYSRRDLTGIL